MNIPPWEMWHEANSLGQIAILKPRFCKVKVTDKLQQNNRTYNARPATNYPRGAMTVLVQRGPIIETRNVTSADASTVPSLVQQAGSQQEDGGESDTDGEAGEGYVLSPGGGGTRRTTMSRTSQATTGQAMNTSREVLAMMEGEPGGGRRSRGGKAIGYV